MNDEIKEIIKETKKLVDNSDYKNCYNYHIFFKVEHIAKLLDYITNLQQENQDLSRMCELYGKSLYNAELTDYKSRIEKAVEIFKDTNVDMPSTLLIETIDNGINVLNGKE